MYKFFFEVKVLVKLKNINKISCETLLNSLYKKTKEIKQTITHFLNN